MLPSNTIVIDERTTSSKGLSQAYALRDVAYQLALQIGMKPEALTDAECERARAVTNLVKAWECADDRIRIHRGKPLPGSLRPAPRKEKQRRKDTRPLEPLGLTGAPVTPVTDTVAPPSLQPTPDKVPQIES